MIEARNAVWLLAVMVCIANCGVQADGERRPVDERLEEVEMRLAELEKLKSELETMKASEMKKADEQKKPSEKFQPSVKFSGYIQGQFARDTGEGQNTGEFDVRRGRIKLDAKILPNASLTFQTENARGVDLRDAFLDLDLKQVRVRAGQFKVPLSFQILESSGNRLSPERVLANLRSVPGERDRGVLFDIPLDHTNAQSPIVQIGLFNGRGINQSDNNTDEDIIGAIHFPNKPVSARLAYLWGRFKNLAPPNGNGQNSTKVRYSADVQYDQEPWNVQFQYTRGRGDFPTAGQNVNLADLHGGYFQVAHKRAKNPVTLLARYQFFDPNANAANSSIHGLLLGLVVDPNKALRYVLAVERLDDRARPNARYIVTLRTQLKY